MSQTTMCDVCRRTENEAGQLADVQVRTEGQTLSGHICRSCLVRLPGYKPPEAETGGTA